MHVDSADLLVIFNAHDLRSHGFSRLSASVHDGFVLLAGHFSQGDHAADFTCRMAPVTQAGRALHLVFYDTRVYGFLPLPGAHLARYLWRALRWPAWCIEHPAVWQLRPIDAFARELLPRGGWKIPAMHQLQELTVTARSGQLHMACGESSQPAVQGPDVPTEALQASDGIALNACAEAALHEGKLDEAYQLLRRAVDDGQGGPWAVARLLHVGAALPQFAVDLRQYAQQFLERGLHAIQARLTLASLAAHSGSHAAAAAHLGMLAQQAQQNQEGPDAAAAWLAKSRLQVDIDLLGALDAGHAAVALAPQQPAMHLHMYELHRQAGNAPQAAQAAERWAQHCDKRPESAQTFCELGHFFYQQVEDFSKSRRMYEHALERVPEHPPALQGLAELHLQRGDTSHAVTFFARLAAHWEQAGNVRQAVACHLRLAEIWQHRLGDSAASAARYKKVVALDPNCLHALMTLADLAYAAEDNEDALGHYQAVIAADVAGMQQAPEQAVHAYERAVSILRQASASKDHASLQLTYLDRLCALRPKHPEAHALRLSLLRSQKIYDRLAQALMEQASHTCDDAAACRLLLEAAQIAQDALQNDALLHHLLAAVCARRPAHHQALETLVPLLQKQGDWSSLIPLLAAAAEATDDPTLAIGYWGALAQAQVESGRPESERVATLERVLALCPDDLPTAKALVDTLESAAVTPAADLAQAYEHLARALTDPTDKGHALMKAARYHARGPQAVAAARQAVSLTPHLAAAHFLLAEVLEANGETQQVQQAFAACAQQVADEDDLAETWARQARWAQRDRDGALEVQALQNLAGMDRLTPEQALDLVAALQATGQTDRAVVWLEQWADAGAPVQPSDALLRAASLLQSTQAHERAYALLERVLRHPPHHAQRAAQELEQLAQVAHNADWLAQAWRAQIALAPNETWRALKQARLLLWQTDNCHPEGLDTARALRKTQPRHSLACHVLAGHHDSEKAWIEGLEVRLTMLGAPPDPADSECRRAAYLQAASVAADLRPQALGALQAGFRAEFAEGELVYEALTDQLASQQRWDDLLALRREQQRREPGVLAWQRAIATLLQERFGRLDEARHMWRAICVADPSDAESLAQWLQNAERAGDIVALAAGHAAIARHASDPQTAWRHALQCAELHIEALNDAGEARAFLHDCLASLPKPPDVAPLLDRLMALRMFATVLDLAPKGWLDTQQTPAWTERIEACLQGLGKHFDHIAFVLHQAPLGTYDNTRATALLIRLMVHCPPASLPEHQAWVAAGHAFCAQSLHLIDPERALEHCLKALPHHLVPHSLTALHASLLLATDRFAEAADLHALEAGRADLGAAARYHFEALADVCAEHLKDPVRARWALEQAVQHAPGDADLLRRLLATLQMPQERAAFVSTAEALLATSPAAQQDVGLLQQVAHACADSDKPRAIALLRSAMSLVPDDATIAKQWQTLSQAPFTTTAVPADVRRAVSALPLAPAPHPRTADPVLQNIHAWQAATEREPRNLAYRERYAAACAQSADHWPTAKTVYLDLLQRDCTHTPWLRVLARLEGAQGHRRAAYGFYAALLAVQPADSEAQRFVQACRQLRPSLPVRPLLDNDWERLRRNFAPHPQHSQPADATARTIAPRALSPIAPQDTRIAPLAALLETLALSVPSLCLWPAGGRACIMAPDGERLMFGAALLHDMPHRAGLFLGLRAVLQNRDAETHPAHANNGALVLAADVAEAIEALCAAQGMLLAPQASRAALIKKTPELVDLLRFAQSAAYFELRREL